MDNNSNNIPSTMEIIRENLTTQYSGQKTCPRCKTVMSSSITLCPNCSAYTAGTTVPESKRKVASSGRQQSKEMNKRAAAGCLIELLVIAGLVSPFVAAAFLPEYMRMYVISFAMIIVSGLIYLLVYWLIVKVYKKQIPITERVDNADQFSGNFRMSERK